MALFDDQGELSPPYPGHTATSRTLYHHLELLARWVEQQQEGLRELLPAKLAERFAVVPSLPPVTVWDGVGVSDKYVTLMWMRRLREGWDHAIRLHEDAWESRAALKQRYELVLTGQHILNSAFIGPEQREARQEKACDEASRKMKQLNDHIKQVLIPPELQGDPDVSVNFGGADSDDAEWDKDDETDESD